MTSVDVAGNIPIFEFCFAISCPNLQTCVRSDQFETNRSIMLDCNKSSDRQAERRSCAAAWPFGHNGELTTPWEQRLLWCKWPELGGSVPKSSIAQHLPMNASLSLPVSSLNNEVSSAIWRCFVDEQYIIHRWRLHLHHNHANL